MKEFEYIVQDQLGRLQSLPRHIRIARSVLLKLAAPKQQTLPV